MIRVLLADDQALLRMGLRIVIDTEDDLTVIGEASDGAEAVRAVAELQPDVVLMDVRMPGVDGITATAQITARHPASRVLILTTFDVDQYVFDGLRAGASGFLLKDAAPGELVNAIRTVARGDAVLGPTAARRLVDRFAALPADSGSDRAARPEIVHDLTEREREVFLLVARGYSNREIAGRLHLSEHTVKVHVGRILAKLDLRDRIQAVVLAYESGLVIPEID
ncbi:two component transcriptional regulator, LuxR family [Parafrankia sp. EAN1pec]|uniref:response regulator n=1 Tax=Parafrankia sp. (strain EAN1pec) TaxID=298653 RepID=UPI00005421E8|nr:two component transcriptional regulator, LuxR family [Frankia sp. EAN1pec]